MADLEETPPYTWNPLICDLSSTNFDELDHVLDKVELLFQIGSYCYLQQKIGTLVDWEAVESEL